MKRTLFTCACSNIEHSFVVTSDEDYVFIEIHLAGLPFWSRLKNAIRYVLGKKSKWGDFEEVLLVPYDAVKLGDSLLEWATGESVAFTPNDVY